MYLSVPLIHVVKWDGPEWGHPIHDYYTHGT